MKLSQTLLFGLTCLITACDSGANRTESESDETPQVTRKGDVELHQTGLGEVRIATDEDDDHSPEDSEPVQE